jgi:hypothetical protein
MDERLHIAGEPVDESQSSRRCGALTSFRRFLLRGVEHVRGKWVLVRTTHNILKLCRHCG